MVGAVASQALTLTVTNHIAKLTRDFYIGGNMTRDEVLKLSDDELQTEIVAHGLFDLNDFRNPVKDVLASIQILDKFDAVRIIKTFGMSGTIWAVKIEKVETFQKTISRAICCTALIVTLENE